MVNAYVFQGWIENPHCQGANIEPGSDFVADFALGVPGEDHLDGEIGGTGPEHFLGVFAGEPILMNKCGIGSTERVRITADQKSRLCTEYSTETMLLNMMGQPTMKPPLDRMVLSAGG